jgi:hypothetical protein
MEGTNDLLKLTKQLFGTVSSCASKMEGSLQICKTIYFSYLEK